MVLKIDEYEKSSDYEDEPARGKPPKKPSRNLNKTHVQKRKFVSKLSPKGYAREQRSSSEDSITKLLQSAPLIHEEEEDDDGFAISKESYSKLSKMKAQMVFSETELGSSSTAVVTMPVTVSDNISELDSLLADLSSVRYNQGEYNNNANAVAGSIQSNNQQNLPSRPPPPKNYGNEKPKKSSNSVPSSPVPQIAARIPRRRPPKLMHVLSKDGRQHDLCKEAREDYSMDLEVELDMDYDYSNYGGSVSNYSTLRTMDTREREPDYDYGTLNKSEVPVSEDELEKATGAGPRGDRSRLIETDSGVVQSKYRYMGFGLWENLDPAAPKKIKKKSPPPPPPKAEPIMYACTVSVSKTISSKELDDLVTKDMFNNMKNREVEVADGVGDLGEGIGEPFEMFEKEDMSDMFKRAMLEKMGLVDDPPAKYKCCVCSKLIYGRCVTANGSKFHPECFVCTYCRGPFKERKFKTNPRDRKPYCKDCFEKLLGHFGDAHAALG